MYAARRLCTWSEGRKETEISKQTNTKTQNTSKEHMPPRILAPFFSSFDDERFALTGCPIGRTPCIRETRIRTRGAALYDGLPRPRALPKARSMAVVCGRVLPGLIPFFSLRALIIRPTSWHSNLNHHHSPSPLPPPPHVHLEHRRALLLPVV